MSQGITESKGSWPGVERLSFLPGDSWISGTRKEDLNTAGNPELGPGRPDREEVDDGSAINPDRQEQNLVPDRRGSIINGE